MNTVKYTDEFSGWLNSLKDVAGKARILSRIDRLAGGNAGDHRDLKGGVSELKIDFGPGYRVYYTKVGNTIIVLICGGDKSTQRADIKVATVQAAKIKSEVTIVKAKK